MSDNGHRGDAPEHSGYNHTWGCEIPEKGHVMVPNTFVDYAADAGINDAEYRLITAIARHHFNRPTGAAWPAQETLARHVGKSRERTNHWVRRLVTRGLLAVEPHPHLDTLIYHVGPAFQAAVIARCAVEAKGARLTAEQVEAVLDSGEPDVRQELLSKVREARKAAEAAVKRLEGAVNDAQRVLGHSVVNVASNKSRDERLAFDLFMETTADHRREVAEAARATRRATENVERATDAAKAAPAEAEGQGVLRKLHTLPQPNVGDEEAGLQKRHTPLLRKRHTPCDETITQTDEYNRRIVTDECTNTSAAEAADGHEVDTPAELSEEVVRGEANSWTGSSNQDGVGAVQEKEPVPEQKEATWSPPSDHFLTLTDLSCHVLTGRLWRGAVNPVKDRTSWDNLVVSTSAEPGEFNAAVVEVCGELDPTSLGRADLIPSIRAALIKRGMVAQAGHDVALPVDNAPTHERREYTLGQSAVMAHVLDAAPPAAD